MALGSSVPALGQQSGDEDFTARALKLREKALEELSPHVLTPLYRNPATETKWKRSIITTVFSIGERRGGNQSSAWEDEWQKKFGGYDDPNVKARTGFIPSTFKPGLNPFYVALPYNDVVQGTTKPEARVVIPWFRSTFMREGASVCKDHWVAIRKGERVAYAQWSDCGPFRSDHYQYVFGPERPLPNASGGAGLSISPAVRDYLGLESKDATDWKFLDIHDVPPGPWTKYGANNPLVGKP